MSINSGKPAGSETASKAAMLSGSSQPKPLLFLDQLEVDVTGTIVVMIGRVWDVNAITGRYLSTDFVVSDSKGNMIHCSAKSSVAHNFLRLKEGGIYSVKNFVVLPNKDEFQIFRHDMFMIEFDGETTARKVSADPHGFCRYPFRLIEFDQVEPANNKYLIDIAGGQSLRVTLWGELGDVLVEKKTKHARVCAMVLTRERCPLQRKACGEMGLKKGGITRPMVMKSAGKVLRESLRNRYMLKVMAADDTAHTVVVTFNDTATELLKCSAESLMGTEDEYSDAGDELNLPINPNASAEDNASSSTPAVTANDAEPSMKIVMKPPTVCTPLKPNEEKKQKGHDLEDSDVDEVSDPPKNKEKSNADVVVDTQKKRKRYTARSYGPAQEFKFDCFTLQPENDPIFHRHPAKFYYSGINPLPFPDTTRLNSADIAGPLTSKYASTRLPRRSAGPTHLCKAKKGTKKVAFISACNFAHYTHP
ncbi:mediator of RNA polymerase II transcription subunit 34 isoform X2 [Tanacetum coccineum]